MFYDICQRFLEDFEKIHPEQAAGLFVRLIYRGFQRKGDRMGFDHIGALISKFYCEGPPVQISVVKAVHETPNLRYSFFRKPRYDGDCFLDFGKRRCLLCKLCKNAYVRRDTSDAVMEVHEDLLFFDPIPLLFFDPFLVLLYALFVEFLLFFFRLFACSDIEEGRDDCGRPLILDNSCGHIDPALLAIFRDNLKFIFPGKLLTGQTRLSAFTHHSPIIRMDYIPKIHGKKFILLIAGNMFPGGVSIEELFSPMDEDHGSRRLCQCTELSLAFLEGASGLFELLKKTFRLFFCLFAGSNINKRSDNRGSPLILREAGRHEHPSLLAVFSNDLELILNGWLAAAQALACPRLDRVQIIGVGKAKEIHGQIFINRVSANDLCRVIGVEEFSALVDEYCDGGGISQSAEFRFTL